MAHRRPTQAELEKIVNDWNATHPIGTAVVLQRGNQDFHTRTRSAAQILGDHTPVVWVDGLSGCYDLDHITPIK